MSEAIKREAVNHAADILKEFDADPIRLAVEVMWRRERLRVAESALEKILQYCKGGEPCAVHDDKPCSIHEHEIARNALAKLREKP